MPASSEAQCQNVMVTSFVPRSDEAADELEAALELEAAELEAAELEEAALELGAALELEAAELEEAVVPPQAASATARSAAVISRAMIRERLFSCFFLLF